MHRRFLMSSWILCIFLVPTWAGAEQEATWPVKPVRMIVGYPAGGPNDTIARAIGHRMTATIKQPVIVENRVGASGVIGSEYVARADPDGYTLMLNAVTHSIVNALNDKLSFDADRDFTAVSEVGTSALVLVVNPDVPVHSLKDLIALATSQPGKIAFASTGNGTSPHLAGEMFKQMTGLDLLHVPYKGSAPAITDLVGGRVQVMFEALPSAAPYIKSGKLRPIAVSTLERNSDFPDLPTIAEAGLPGFDITVWWGVFGPANIPKALVDRISSEINATLTTAEIKTQFATLGITPTGSTPEEFRAVLQGDMKKYAKLIKDAKIHAN